MRIPAFYRLSLLFVISSVWSSCSTPATKLVSEEFSQNIRTTEARTPAEELAGFRLPPGFEIQLFASEPDIGKPLNMAFDAKGRMWLTQSYAYPFADTTGTAKDKISILEDTDGDGRADEITTFAEGLNIPIGIVPVQDGAIAYSIPSIDHYIDHDGDDKVDERKVLYEGFEYKDTHGMINNLMRSWDGWIHADHGFANRSVVAGSDGDTIVLNSGNTFRFRPDGSHLEFTTTGRVNPYGYAYDERGYTYSSDCHTSPIYQLVRGADYPHFSKQPTGIGFGPALMDHNHGSTALAGLEYYLGTQFPEAYRESFFLGDVVKSRVYRATMEMQGTTPQITWEDDFLLSEDPWFRPVDVKLGPDGALYIADFYNRIIGHYEVPLDHPGRDRQRGRIWRIVYTGKKAPQQTPAVDWTTVNMETLLDGLDHPNLPLRMSVADQIVDRFGQEAVAPIRALRQKAETSPRQSVQGLWILFRLDKISETELSAAIQSEEELLRIHGLRIVFEGEQAIPTLVQLAADALKDPSVHVQRQATMVLSRYPSPKHLSALLQLRHRVSEEDSHFFYSIRQAIRDQLREESVLQWALEQEWEESYSRTLAELMRGVDTEPATRFLVRHLDLFEESLDLTGQFARHIGRYSTTNTLSQLIALLQKRTHGNETDTYGLFEDLEEGLAERGASLPPSGKQWGQALATSFLQAEARETGGWRVIPHDQQPYGSNPWRLVELNLDDSRASRQLIASGPTDGSGYVASSLRSPEFQVPARLRFFLAGQQRELGANETPSAPSNWVELRLADTDSLITKTLATESQLNQTVEWSLESYEGMPAYLLLVDGSRAGGDYIAIGNLDPAIVSLPSQSPDQQAQTMGFAARVAGTYEISTLQPVLEELLTDQQTDVYVRSDAAEALLAFNRSKALKQIQAVVSGEDESLLLKERLSLLLSTQGQLAPLISELPYRTQKQVAENLLGSATGLELLLTGAEEGIISPRLLMEPQIQQSLAATASSSQQALLASLTADVPLPSQEIQTLIDARMQGFRMQRHSPEGGKQVFGQHCATCHQLKGEGGKIGPQLDGIGNWGLQALTEKILDPNRNISKAFKNYTLRLKDGQTKSGLFQREEGQVLVFSDVAGQEFSIPKADIVEQKLSPYTLMPAYFGELIPEEEYYALMAYLLNEK